MIIVTHSNDIVGLLDKFNDVFARRITDIDMIDRQNYVTRLQQLPRWTLYKSHIYK